MFRNRERHTGIVLVGYSKSGYQDFGVKEQPVFRLVLAMSLPNVLSMLVSSMYNIVDSFFVAQISENAMTALSLVFPVQNLISAIGIGFGIGINAMIAFYQGASGVWNAFWVTEVITAGVSYALYRKETVVQV